MASKIPPPKGVAYTFRVALFAQADNQIKITPTIAAGDIQVSLDGGAFANLTTLPSESPAGSGQVLVSLSDDEMDADEPTVRFIDASGAEWHSFFVSIPTAAQTLDAVATALADVPTNAELTAALADLPTNAELTTALSDLPTNGELTTALTDLPTNAELVGALAAADDAVLAAIGALNNLSSAQAQTAATAALNAYDPPTKAELDAADDAVLAAIAALSLLDAAGVRTAVGLAAANLDTQLAALPTATENADAVISRGFANVENSAELGSIAELLMGAFESAVVGTTWTIRKAGGTTFNTRTLTTSAAAEPITSVT